MNYIIDSEDPRKGEGWGGFLEDEDEVWFEAFETKEVNGEEVIDVEAYEEFDNLQELVNFVAGAGSYEETRGFTPGQEDLVDKKREMKNDQWKIPSKLEEIDNYLERGAMRGEIDVDPNATVRWSVNEKATRREDKNKKYVASFIAYDPDQTGEDEEPTEYFYIQTHWYDTPPEEINLEEVFDIENIRTEKKD